MLPRESSIAFLIALITTILKDGMYPISIYKGVPISFNTHWRDEGGYLDVETSIEVHEALEHEFGIEIKDRNVLISDVETAYYIITQHHDSLW